MFLPRDPADSPVVSFSFVDPGLESLDSFKTHLDAYTPLFLQLPELGFYYVATQEKHWHHAKNLFLRLFERHWNPDSPGGIVDYFCLRKQAENSEMQQLSTPDRAALNGAKAKFNYREIEILYQQWRAGERHFQQVREEYHRMRRPQRVAFTFSPVNGQVALFERHPHSLVKTPWKSAKKPLFSEDFTYPVYRAEPQATEEK